MLNVTLNSTYDDANTCVAGQSYPIATATRTVMLYFWASPVIMCIGLMGNVLTICIMIRRMKSSSYKSCTSPLLLLCLAIADSSVLLTSLTHAWLWGAFNLNVRTLSPFSCKIHMFMTYYVNAVANWILCAFCVFLFNPKHC